MKPKSAIQKGKLLEKFVVGRLRQTGLDERAARTPGSGSGLAKGDIWNAQNIAFECKNQKNFSKAWIEQAERQQIGEEAWAIVWHSNFKPLEDSVVIIPWYFFESLLINRKLCRDKCLVSSDIQQSNASINSAPQSGEKTEVSRTAWNLKRKNPMPSG